MKYASTVLSPGATAIRALCFYMEQLPVYELQKIKPELKQWAERFPEYAGFLSQEPADVLKRYRMGEQAQWVPSRY